MPAVTPSAPRELDVRGRRLATRRAATVRPGGARPAAGRKAVDTSRGRLRLSLRHALALGIAILALGGGAIAGWALWKSGKIEQLQAWASERRDQVLSWAPFPLQDVTVDGRRHVTQDAVLKAIDMRRGQSLLAADLHGARDRLERIEWVEHAAVERRWPDTIHVVLRERQAIALWQNTTIGADGRPTVDYVLIDRLGRKVRSVDPGEMRVPLMLAGEGAPEAVGSLFLVLQDARPIAERIKAAVFVGQRRWNLVLDSGLQIRLPEEDTGAALQRLLALDRSHRLLSRDLSVVDVRLPDYMVLRAAGAADPLLAAGARAEPPAGATRPASPPARPQTNDNNNNNNKPKPGDTSAGRRT